MRAPCCVMDFATITQFGGALAALIPLVLIVGFAVVIWRTVSLHTLLRRLWLLVHRLRPRVLWHAAASPT